MPDTERIIYRLSMLAALLRDKVPPAVLAATAEMVEGYGEEKVAAACSSWAKKGRFFPRPSELLTEINGERRDRPLPPPVEVKLLPPGPKSRTKQGVVDSFVEGERRKPGYIRSTYIGSRLLKGSNPESKLIREVAEELLGPTMRKKVDEEMANTAHARGVRAALASVERRMETKHADRV